MTLRKVERMSRVICPKCGNTDVSWIRDDEDCAQYICPECRQGFCYPPKTLFERITASTEALAPEFVEMMYDRVAGDYRYYSMLTGEFYNNREEAIAATIEKLNEIEKDEQ